MAAPSKFPISHGQTGGFFTPYADGQIWKLTRGVDFQQTTMGLRNYAGSWAKLKGFRSKTQVVGDDLYVQFLPKDGAK